MIESPRRTPLGLFPDQPKPRLYDRTIEVFRVRHYSKKTEEAYCYWIRKYIAFHAPKVDAKKLATVGREMVNELREAVKERLLAAIEKPIRRKCQTFVSRNSDVGTGVKDRMHELLEDLIDDSLAVAVPVAQAILIENYQVVEREIRKTFENYQDPLKAVFETMVEKFSVLDESENSHRRSILSDITVCLDGRKDLVAVNAR